MNQPNNNQPNSKKHWFYTTETLFKESGGRTYEVKRYNYPHIIGTTIGLVLLLSLVFGSIRTVGAGEVGIVTRFGEVNRVAQSGLTFKLPLIEGMTKMETRVQKHEVQTDAATKDLQEVNGALAVNYTLSNENALRVYKELGVNYSNTVILPILQETFKQGIAGYTAEVLMANRTDVKNNIQEALTERLSTYGITVVDANITDLNFSAEFNKAIEQKAVMQQEAERARQELEKVKIESEAKVEAAKAEAEAQRLQQETLSELMIKKMMIEKWDGCLPEVVSDSTILKDLGV